MEINHPEAVGRRFQAGRRDVRRVKGEALGRWGNFWRGSVSSFGDFAPQFWWAEFCRLFLAEISGIIFQNCFGERFGPNFSQRDRQLEFLQSFQSRYGVSKSDDIRLGV